MTRREQGIVLAASILAVILGVLAAAQADASRPQCVLAFPKWLGCVLAAHENLAGGLIAAGGALFAGWLAWTAVRDQTLAARAISARTEEQTFEAIRYELGPLLDLINVVWRIVEETLQFQGAALERTNRVAAVRDNIAWAMPSIDLVDHLEDIGRELGPVPRRRFLRVATNVRLLYRLLERVKADERPADLKGELHEIRLLEIQLAHLLAAVKNFDPVAADRFADRHPIALSNRSWARQLEEADAIWREEEARHRDADASAVPSSR